MLGDELGEVYFLHGFEVVVEDQHDGVVDLVEIGQRLLLGPRKVDPVGRFLTADQRVRKERRGAVSGDEECEALVLRFVLKGELEFGIGRLHELLLLVFLAVLLVHSSN